MKIAVVGGGSTYTPELVDGLGRLRDVLPVEELVLVDPAADRLELVGAFGRRILDRLGHPAELVTSTELEPALDGVDAVLLQLRVGGQAARLEDETWPLECGCVGQETTGRGWAGQGPAHGPGRARHRRAGAQGGSDAWIIDFTNPVGIVTRALLQEGHRAVGLCNVAIGFQRRFAAQLGVAPEQVQLDHVGLNHLTWERAVTVDGADRLPELLAAHGPEIAESLELPVELLHTLGVVPSYYLRYFYAHDQVVAELRESESRAARVAEIEQELLDMYADPALDEKPELLTQRGGAFYSEAAVQLAAVAARPPRGAQHPGGQPPQRGHPAVPARRRGDRGAGRRRRGRGASTPRRPARAVVRRPGRARSRRTSTWPWMRPCTAATTGSSVPCWPTRWWVRSTSPTVSPTGWSPTTATTSAGPDMHDDQPDGRRDTSLDDRAAVLAIDAGNSKTDVAIVTEDGTVRGRARGGSFRPDRVGAETAVAGLVPLVERARAEAGLEGTRAVARQVAACLANADLPVEHEALEAAIAARGWAGSIEVFNDTFALLRAGLDEPRGVAVVCGAGINCAGLLPDGRTARFAAVGHISGDWGGGGNLWQEAMWSAARAVDGRGPATRLSDALPHHAGLATMEDLIAAVHLGTSRRPTAWDSRRCCSRSPRRATPSQRRWYAVRPRRSSRSRWPRCAAWGCWASRSPSCSAVEC